MFKKKKKNMKKTAPFVPTKQKKLITKLNHKRKKFEKIMVNKLTLTGPQKLG